jgi:hypothetical protein
MQVHEALRQGGFLGAFFLVAIVIIAAHVLGGSVARGCSEHVGGDVQRSAGQMHAASEAGVALSNGLSSRTLTRQLHGLSGAWQGHRIS